MLIIYSPLPHFSTTVLAKNPRSWTDTRKKSGHVCHVYDIEDGKWLSFNSVFLCKYMVVGSKILALEVMGNILCVSLHTCTRSGKMLLCYFSLSKTASFKYSQVMYYAFNLYTIFDRVSYHEAEFNPIVFSLLPNISTAQYFDSSNKAISLNQTRNWSKRKIFQCKKKKKKKLEMCPSEHVWPASQHPSEHDATIMKNNNVRSFF